MEKIKDVIYLDDCRESMIAGFRNELNHDIRRTGFTSFNRHYNWLRKDLTVFAGMGGSGKSTLYLQLATLQSKMNDERFAVFSPEQDPPDYFYNDVVHMYLGTFPNKKYMNEADYFRALDYVKDHFFYIYPETEAPTPDYINTRFEQLIETHGVGGVCVDPFDQLENDWASTMNRDDKYVSKFLRGCKRFANQHNVYYDVITHTNNTVTTNERGDFNTPHVGNLAGGAKWNNNTDNLIIVHRPYSESDPDNRETIVKFAKIKKQKIVGVRGEITLTFDRKRNRFMDAGGSPLDENYGYAGDGEMEFDEPF